MEAPVAAQHKRTFLIVLATAIMSVATYYLLPDEVNELARRTAAIFVVAAIFWATEVIPLFATSLLIVAFEIFFLAHRGGLADVLPPHSAFPVGPDGTPIQLRFSIFLEPFASDIIILFLGGFLISAAMVRTELDRAIASKFLRPVSTRPALLVFAILAVTGFFSMWMSNTAAAAMMMAIIAPIYRELPPGHRYTPAPLLAVAFGANIGGLGTPIGTPPNAIALDVLRRAGYQIDFAHWMLMAVPLMLLMLAITGVLLLIIFPPGRDLTLRQISSVERLTRDGRITLTVLLIAIVLWVSESVHGINAAVVALAAATALTTVGILGRRDINTIDWDVLVLMWGGLSLGQALKASGLIDHVASLPLNEFSGVALVAIVLVVTATIGTFMSNTAAANLLVPMAMSIPGAVSDQLQLAVLVALACSFGMAMPVSTPPNAIVFASGRIPVRSMIVAGTTTMIIGIVMLILGYQFILPWVVQSVISQ